MGEGHQVTDRGQSSQRSSTNLTLPGFFQAKRCDLTNPENLSCLCFMSFGVHIVQCSTRNNPGKSVEKLQTVAVPQRHAKTIETCEDSQGRLDEAMSS